jgi:23S rRNA (pseudouridine1915-N3)-methyltransferase
VGRLRFTIVHVGKLRQPHVVEGLERYRKLLSSYVSLEMRPIKQEPLRDCLDRGDAREREAQRIIETLSPRDTLVALDVSGRPFTSPEFARYLGELERRGHSSFTFVVGGPTGLSPQVIRRSHLALSLSPMTFSHELTILALAEQLYRAVASLHNHPYAK